MSTTTWETWKDVLESIGRKHSSRKAWSLLKKLLCDPVVSSDYVDVIAKPNGAQNTTQWKVN